MMAISPDGQLQKYPRDARSHRSVSSAIRGGVFDHSRKTIKGRRADEPALISHQLHPPAAPPRPPRDQLTRKLIFAGNARTYYQSIRLSIIGGGGLLQLGLVF